MAREIVTKGGRFYCLSLIPDICKTPIGNSTPPIPYNIKGEFAEAESVSPNVSSHSEKVVLFDRSYIPTVTGDSPGTANGLKSGTVGKRVQTKEKSSTFRFNGAYTVREGDVVRMNDDNTTGKIYERGGEAAQPRIDADNSAAPAEAPAEQKPASLWDKASPWVHGGLGLASFVPGLSVVTGGIDAAIYAGEGNMVEAGLSAAAMIPGGKLVTTAGKVVKGAAGMVKGAHAAEEAAKALKEAEAAAKAMKEAKAAKEAEEAAKAGKTEEKAAAKGKDGGKSKGKKKLKCGEDGKYGDLKKKTGDGKFDRDHIPSKAALKTRAEDLNGGQELSIAQKRAIDNWGNAIAIPRQAHIDVSPTYGQSAAEAAKDAENLAGSAKRDVDEMLKKIDDYDADGGCKKAYKQASKKILKMTNKDYDNALQKILDNIK